MFCFPLLKIRWQAPYGVDCTRPQVTKLRLNHSFYLSQKWNLEPAHQESPDQQSSAYGRGTQPPANHAYAPRPHRGLGQPLILRSSLELFLSVCTECCLIHELFRKGSVVSRICSVEPCPLMALKLAFSFLTYIYNPLLCMNWGQGRDTRPSKQPSADRTPLTEKASALHLCPEAGDCPWWVSAWTLLWSTDP